MQLGEMRTWRESLGVELVERSQRAIDNYNIGNHKVKVIIIHAELNKRRKTR